MAEASRRDALPGDRRGRTRAGASAAGALGALGHALTTYWTPRCPRCRSDEPPTADAATAAELGAPMLRWQCVRCGHCWPQPLDPFVWLA